MNIEGRETGPLFLAKIIPDVLIESPVIFETVIGFYQRSAVFKGKCPNALSNLHIRHRDRLCEHRRRDRKLRLNDGGD